ncbi:MAG: DUF483 domain-containing protein [Nanoarchaeota archaeon]
MAGIYNLIPQKFKKVYVELLAVYNGLKPVVRINIKKGDLVFFRKIARQLGLQVKIVPIKLMFYSGEYFKWVQFDEIPENQSFTILISKQEALLNTAYNLELGRSKGGIDEHMAAQLYNYPSCCVDGYLKELGNNKDADYVTVAFQNTNSKLKSILNFLLRESEDDYYGQFYLISHFPCSFECQKSIEYAERLLKMLYNDNKEFTHKCKWLLKRPVVYDKWLMFSVLNDIIGREVIFNHGINEKSQIKASRILEFE